MCVYHSLDGKVNAVFAADAVSRVSGSVGVAVLTAGPGLTNTITAVKNAQVTTHYHTLLLCLLLSLFLSLSHSLCLSFSLPLSLPHSLPLSLSLTHTHTLSVSYQMAASPVLIFGGATATLLKGRGSLQDIDQFALFRPHVKWMTSLSSLSEIVPSIEYAFYIAKSGMLLSSVTQRLRYAHHTARRIDLKERICV